MPGYTKEQLEAKGAVLSNYVLCSNCSLYWHKHAFKKHLRPSSKEWEIAVGHPVWESLLDFAIPFEFTIPPGPRAKRARAPQPLLVLDWFTPGVIGQTGILPPKPSTSPTERGP